MLSLFLSTSAGRLLLSSPPLSSPLALRSLKVSFIIPLISLPPLGLYPASLRHVVLERSVPEPASCRPQVREQHRSRPIQEIPHFFLLDSDTASDCLKSTPHQCPEELPEPTVMDGSSQLFRHGRCSARPYHAAKARGGVSHCGRWLRILPMLILDAQDQRDFHRQGRRED